MAEETLAEFLSIPDVDLAKFHQKLVGIGVNRVQHLQDVADEDFAGIGMTSVEIRRLKRGYAGYKKRMKKSKGFLHKVIRYIPLRIP
jgi:hypothetical protein